MQPIVNLAQLTHSSLFNGFTDDELADLLGLLEAEQMTYNSEKTIIREGERNPFIFVVLNGVAVAVKYDLGGKEEIYTRMTVGSVFGDVLAVSANSRSPVTVIAYPEAIILKFRFEVLVSAQARLPELRTRLLKNLTSVLAQKFFDLQDRVNILIRPTLREKIITFLYAESKKHRNTTFNISLNRERMAAYLNTDRSALSRELSNLKKEELIDYYKNTFKVKGDKFER